MQKFSHVAFLLINILLFGCKEAESNKCLLPNTYSSENFPVTLRLNKNWKAYEFGENNVGIEYQGLDNFEKRYEAEIIITFNHKNISKEEYDNLPIAYLDKVTSTIDKMGGQMNYKKERVKVKEEFADKKWNVIASEISILLNQDTLTRRDVYYTWYSPQSQITVRAYQYRSLIPEVNSEIDCIIHKMVLR